MSRLVAANTGDRNRSAWGYASLAGAIAIAGVLGVMIGLRMGHDHVRIVEAPRAEAPPTSPAAGRVMVNDDHHRELAAGGLADERIPDSGRTSPARLCQPGPEPAHRSVRGFAAVQGVRVCSPVAFGSARMRSSSPSSQR